MRKSMFVSFATLVLGASLALTGCKVGDDGGGGGGDNPGDEDVDPPDAGGGGGEPCPPSVEEFETNVFDVAFKSEFLCVGCHGGGAGGFTLVADDMAANLAESTEEALKDVGGTPALLLKPTGGGGHVGGKKYEVGSPEYQALEEFVGQVTGEACD